MQGSVRKVANHRWRLVFDAKPDPETGKRRQVTRTITARTRRDAEEQLRALIARHGRSPDVRRTLTELVERWLAHTEADLAARTIEERRRIWRRHVQPTLGDMDTAAVTPAVLNDLYAAIRATGREATARHVHALLHGAFEFAVSEEWIATNPASRTRRPKQPRTSIRVPEVADVAAILAVADTTWPEFGVLVRVAAVTGMRRGEVCALRWTDLDLDAGIIHVRRAVAAISGQLIEKTTKTDQDRDLSIGTTTIAMLRRHRTRLAERLLACGATLSDDSYVFPSDLEATKPTYPSTVTHRWAACRTTAGVPTIRLHDLRHHSASQLVAGNVDLAAVMQRHGWTSLATAQRYIHAVNDTDRAAAALLDDILDQTS